MKLKELQNIFHKDLDALYEKEEVDNFFFILIESMYSVSRLKLALEPEYVVDKTEAILKALNLLKQEKPIQYILGETEFFGLPFKVNNFTLIPRPETEELVAWILHQFTKPVNKPLHILDIGTGSGCIAIALAKNLPNANVFALDISTEALSIAKQNAQLNQVDIEFIEADILNFETIKQVNSNKEVNILDLNFDVIVSNPPYVREQEKQQMKPNVLNNEPHLALFVQDHNPLQFYKAITQFAVTNLNHNGMLFFEINEFLGKDMIQLLVKHQFSNIELKQDIFKKDRMIKGVLNN